MPHKANAIAVTRLQGVLRSLEAAGGRPGVGLIETIKNSITDVIDIMQEGDPFVRRLLLCAAVIQESTEVVETKTNGKLMQKIRVTDQAAYKWAISSIHKVAAGKT